jgi:hypothetical protein
MIIIGLTGYIGSGKDTVADILVKDHGFTKVAFADPIKAEVRRLDPIIGFEQFSGCDDCPDEVEPVRLSDAEKFGFKGDSIKDSPWAEEVRDLWQKYGTELHRADDPNYWVRKMDQEILRLHSRNTGKIVIPDIRFPNEAEFVTDWISWFDSADGTESLWQVSRPGVEADDEHSSEQYVGTMAEDLQIHNNGTLEELATTVTTALSMTLAGSIPGQLALDIEGWV